MLLTIYFMYLLFLATERYHKLYVESPAVQKSRNRLSIEQKQDSFARKPPTTSTPYQSPLDSFMMLRTGQLQKPTDKENRKVAVVPPGKRCFSQSFVLNSFCIGGNQT